MQVRAPPDRGVAERRRKKPEKKGRGVAARNSRRRKKSHTARGRHNIAGVFRAYLGPCFRVFVILEATLSLTQAWLPFSRVLSYFFGNLSPLFAFLGFLAAIPVPQLVTAPFFGYFSSLFGSSRPLFALFAFLAATLPRPAHPISADRSIMRRADRKQSTRRVTGFR